MMKSILNVPSRDGLGMWSEAELKFCDDEWATLAISDHDLADLLSRHAAQVVNAAKDSGIVVASLLEKAIKDARPFSLIRIGDGEGNALGLTGPRANDLQWRLFRKRFSIMAHCEYEADEALAVCASMRAACDNADVLGFRSVDPFVRGDELRLIKQHLDSNDLLAALGILYARDYLAQSLRQGRFCDKLIVSAWVHLALYDHLRRILDSAHEVIVITGRTSLAEPLEALLGARLRDILLVPPEGYVATDASQSHLRGAFPRISTLIRDSRLDGVLVLVGAGILGKIYCDIAKTSGAVAVDVGSLFDVLAGQFTRPAHAAFAFGNSPIR